ncbi:hypothetical protein TSUD_234340 [Trifolium subterraneum]|uniref:Uncharacterized protein n=1 Tax=Trifolium subterraneum TaxID=3900 RepID=A0A2Z6MAS1_TRISU|nr:hypothetical protein TSUD_234340 [Trifolium subterraneum]
MYCIPEIRYHSFPFVRFTISFFDSLSNDPFSSNSSIHHQSLIHYQSYRFFDFPFGFALSSGRQRFTFVKASPIQFASPNHPSKASVQVSSQHSGHSSLLQSYVFSEIKSTIEGLRTIIEKERQTFAKALSQSSKEDLYIKSKEALSKDVIENLVEMCCGIQNPAPAKHHFRVISAIVMIRLIMDSCLKILLKWYLSKKFVGVGMAYYLREERKPGDQMRPYTRSLLQPYIPDTVSGKLIGLVTGRDEIPDLLKLDDVIDLVVPRGINKLVSQIKVSTKIPVLGHAGMLRLIILRPAMQ